MTLERPMFPPVDPTRRNVLSATAGAAALAPPRANVGDIELLSQTIAIRIWAFRSKHSLATVLGDGFFDGLGDVRLRKNDRLEVIASWDQPLAEHAVLCVDQIDAATGNAKVSLMHRYERVA
jgi:hypothetical protein